MVEPCFYPDAVLRPIALGQPVQRNDLERVGLRFRASHGLRILVLVRIDLARQQQLRAVSPLPGESQGHVPVDTLGEQLLLSFESILQPPPVALRWRDFQIEAAAVEDLLGAVRADAPEYAPPSHGLQRTNAN